MKNASGMRPPPPLDASAHRGMHRAAPARPSPPMSRSPSLGNLSESVQAYGSVKELEIFRNKIVPALNNCAFRQLAVIDDKLDKARAAEQQLEGQPGGGIRPHGPTSAARQRPTHPPTRQCSLRQPRRFATGHGRPPRPAATIPKPLPWLHELSFPGLGFFSIQEKANFNTRYHYISSYIMLLSLYIIVYHLQYHDISCFSSTHDISIYHLLFCWVSYHVDIMSRF